MKHSYHIISWRTAFGAAFFLRPKGEKARLWQEVPKTGSPVQMIPGFIFPTIFQKSFSSTKLFIYLFIVNLTDFWVLVNKMAVFVRIMAKIEPD